MGIRSDRLEELELCLKALPPPRDLHDDQKVCQCCGSSRGTPRDPEGEATIPRGESAAGETTPERYVFHDLSRLAEDHALAAFIRLAADFLGLVRSYLPVRGPDGPRLAVLPVLAEGHRFDIMESAGKIVSAIGMGPRNSRHEPGPEDGPEPDRIYWGALITFVTSFEGLLQSWRWVFDGEPDPSGIEATRLARRIGAGIEADRLGILESSLELLIKLHRTEDLVASGAEGREGSDLGQGPSPPVILGDSQRDTVGVLGAVKPRLGRSAHRVIRALLAHGGPELTANALRVLSGAGDAHGILTRLREDPDWRAVIHLPSDDGRPGYYIRRPGADGPAYASTVMKSERGGENPKGPGAPPEAGRC